jgi:phage shock protein C
VEHLYRSSSQRMIAGICGGFGEYFSIDPTIVRVIFVLVTIATGFILGIVAYLVLWLIIPRQTSQEQSARESMRENVEEMAQSARDLGNEVQATLSNSGSTEARRWERVSLAGLILVIVGFLFLLGNLDLLGWLRWGKFWPLIIIAIGVFLLWRRRY